MLGKYIIAAGAFIFGLVIIAIYNRDEVIIESDEDDSDFEKLKKEIKVIILNTPSANGLHEHCIDTISDDLAKFTLKRNMDFYANGYDNGLKTTVVKYEPKDIESEVH